MKKLRMPIAIVIILSPLLWMCEDEEKTIKYPDIQFKVGGDYTSLNRCIVFFYLKGIHYAELIFNR